MTQQKIKQKKKNLIKRKKISKKIYKFQLMLYVTLILIYSRAFSANVTCR